MRTKKSIILALLVSIFIMGASSAYADPVRSYGYPAVISFSVEVPASGVKKYIVVLLKFQGDSFTYDEAETASAQLNDLIPGLLQLLLNSSLGDSIIVTSDPVYSPSYLMDWGDADWFADWFAYSRDYFDYWDVPIFIDLSKVDAVYGSGFDTSVKVNLWLIDPAFVIWQLTGFELDIPGSYLYVSSLEIPEAYWQLLSGGGLPVALKSGNGQ